MQPWGLSTHIQTFHHLLDLHRRSLGASCAAHGNPQGRNKVAAHTLDVVPSSQVSQSTQFDVHNGPPQAAEHALGVQTPTEATRPDQTHILVTCMVHLVAASASFCCCSHSGEAEGPAGPHPQGARRSLAFEPGMMQLHASPDINDSDLNHGRFGTAVPWWLQQEQHAAADSAAVALSSLVTYTSSVDQANRVAFLQNASQNSQASGSQTTLPMEPPAVLGPPVLPSTLAWTLCSASPAAIASILPILCNRIIFVATSSEPNKGHSPLCVEMSGTAQNVACQSGLATSLLQWEGLQEPWMESLPQYLATASGIEALVACVGDRNSCGLTEPLHIVYTLLLKHALHSPGEIPVLSCD